MCVWSRRTVTCPKREGQGAATRSSRTLPGTLHSRRRQVHQPPPRHPGRAGGGRNADCRLLSCRRLPVDARLPGAARRRHPPRWRLRRRHGPAAAFAERGARRRQLRLHHPHADGSARRPAAHGNAHRRCFPAQPADGTGGQAAAADGRDGYDHRRPAAADGCGRGVARHHTATRGGERTGEDRGAACRARRRRRNGGE